MVLGKAAYIQAWSISGGHSLAASRKQERAAWQLIRSPKGQWY